MMTALSARRGRLAKKLEVSSVEKWLTELGTAYQKAVERVSGFGHGWIHGFLCLERTTL